MNMKKFIIGGVAGGILYFLLGWLVYGVLLLDYMNHHTGNLGHATERREMMEMTYFSFYIIGNLLQGFLLAYIFAKSNINTMMAGLITGAIVGLLLSSAFDCVMYATTLVLSKRGMLADVIAFTAISAVVGAVLGMISNKSGN